MSGFVLKAGPKRWGAGTHAYPIDLAEPGVLRFNFRVRPTFTSHISGAPRERLSGRSACRGIYGWPGMLLAHSSKRPLHWEKGYLEARKLLSLRKCGACLFWNILGGKIRAFQCGLKSLGKKFRATAISLFAALRHCIRIRRPLAALWQPFGVDAVYILRLHSMTYIGPVVTKLEESNPPRECPYLACNSGKARWYRDSKNLSTPDGASA